MCCSADSKIGVLERVRETESETDTERGEREGETDRHRQRETHGDRENGPKSCPFDKRKEFIVSNRLQSYWSILLDTSFTWRKEEAPVCVACNAVIIYLG